MVVVVGGEVLGVELGNARHDPVQQHPGWGLVDVLCRRDERDFGVEQRPVNFDLVEPVAGEPIDLVNDAIRHLVRGDVMATEARMSSERGSGMF